MRDIYTAKDLMARDASLDRTMPRKRQWEMLFSKLQPVHMDNVARVALDCRDSFGKWREDDDAHQLKRNEIHALLNGVDGVERLVTNGRVLVYLAAHLQSRKSSKVDVAEEVFLFFRSMSWNVTQVRQAAENSCLEYWFSTYGRNAAADYYFLTRKLLKLFRKRRSSKVEVLRRALQS